MQHKREAYWFYRYLSNFYDKLVNPLFWTEPMRETALDLENWKRDERVIDVGSGTGFTTQGIVKRVPAGQVTCVDQSPHQMAHAKRKEELQDCTFRIGDAENLPAPTDHFDKYVSAGSIEYWPNPQQGINEAYRVVKPGGRVLIIGPLEPESTFSRFVANTWMLFPTDYEYKQWFKEAGFDDIRVRYIRPHWIRNDRYGIAISGRKPSPGLSPNAMISDYRRKVTYYEPLTFGRSLLLGGRLLLGSIAGFAFIPMALIGYLRAPETPPPPPTPEGPITAPPQPLNEYQKGVLIGAAVIAGLVIVSIFASRRGKDDPRA